MSMRGCAFAAALTVLTMTACAAPPASAPAVTVAAKAEPLSELPIGTRWRLVDSDVDGLAGGAGSRVRMQVDDGAIRGDSSCNMYSARVEWQDGRLRLGAPVSTKRLCGEAERNVAERALYQSFPRVNAARMEGDKLRLLLDDGHSMLFETDPMVAE